MSPQDGTKTKVLMVGVSKETKRGMWSVVSHYLASDKFTSKVELIYIPTATVVSSSHAKKMLFFIKSYAEIRRVLRQEKPEIVHLHASENGSIFRKRVIARKAKRHGAKVVLHMHGGSFFKFYQAGSKQGRKASDELFQIVDAILVLGEEYKDGLIGIGVSPSKIWVIPNGVDVPDSNPYKKKSNEIVYLGGVTHEKGITDLLDAVVAAENEWPEDAVITIYGPTSNLDIKQAISSRKLEGKVAYSGVVSGQEKERAFERADFFVLPSHFEVLPMVVLEAMSWGIPTLSTRVGMVEDIITDGVNGYLCQPENTDSLVQGMRNLFSLSGREIATISGNAHNTILENFSLDTHINSVLAIYRLCSKGELNQNE